MAEPADSTPPTAKFRPPELPAVQLWHPKKPQRKLRGWHIAILVIGVPIIASLTAIGAYTLTGWAFKDPPSVIHLATAKPTPKPTNKQHKPPKPAYDLAGYKATVDGSDEQTFVTALNRFRRDIRALQFQTVTSDAVTLSNAASTYLADVRATNPPPGYQAAKLANITAAIYARRAAAIIQGAISTSNLNALHTGLAEANKAKTALSQAIASTPKGS
jgi:hypothetical protein